MHGCQNGSRQGAIFFTADLALFGARCCAVTLVATNPPRAKAKIDTVLKEVYKQFVDICLTDFCYPRV
jgi:hypothetical protein